MKCADGKDRSRISDALQEPVDAPDVTEFVMAHLPVARRSVVFRRVWAYAVAACLLIALGLCVMLRPTQPRHMADSVPPHTAPRADHQIIAPEKPHQPRVAANPETAIRPDHRRHKSVKPANVPRKHERKSEHTAIPDEQAQKEGGVDYANSSMQSALAEAMSAQLEQNVRVLPPNPDADKIQRPPLTTIVNSGPERTPVTQPGG